MFSPTTTLGRVILAIVTGIVTGIVIWLVGALVALIPTDITVTIGHFLESVAAVVGVLAAIVYFFFGTRTV